MEYVYDPDAVLASKPLPYDHAAIKYLYGLGREKPSGPFCTDEQRATDPECVWYDTGDDPLHDHWEPAFRVLDSYLVRADAKAVQPIVNTLPRLLGFVRAGATPELQLEAYNIAMQKVRSPLDPSRLSTTPDLGVRADDVTVAVFQQLYLLPANRRMGEIKRDPIPTAPLVAQMVTDLKAVIVNPDRARSFNARRTMVDVLKKMQLKEGYAGLVEVKSTLLNARSGMTGDEALLTDDLVARIDRAITPYFD
jgi:hypothetical protein